jgi:hypothetical protein
MCSIPNMISGAPGRVSASITTGRDWCRILADRVQTIRSRAITIGRRAWRILRVWLVTGLITERGVIAPNREALAKAFPDRIANRSLRPRPAILSPRIFVGSLRSPTISGRPESPLRASPRGMCYGVLAAVADSSDMRFHWHWSNWRRRHQAGAKRWAHCHHQKKKPLTDPTFVTASQRPGPSLNPERTREEPIL